jgi:hypothetical protein
MGLFDTHDLFEITHRDYPDERLIDCRKPLLATLTTFVTASDVLFSELRMEAFLPADDATADRLRQRAVDDSVHRS